MEETELGMDSKETTTVTVTHTHIGGSRISVTAEVNDVTIHSAHEAFVAALESIGFQPETIAKILRKQNDRTLRQPPSEAAASNQSSK